jgi:hypothetical protein
MDANAQPLLEYLGHLTEHFKRWPFKNRWKSAHVAKVVPGNWKVAIDAFIESMHVIATHPQALLGGDGSNCEYDIYENFSRSILAPPMPNPNLPYDVSEQDILDELMAMNAAEELDFVVAGQVTLPGGMTAREFLATARKAEMSQLGIDVSGITDLETTGTIWYYVFPNWFPWSGPIFYRFRPNGHDPDSSIMECMLMVDLPPGAERPPPAAIHWLGRDDDWTKAPELGMLGAVFNQDMANVPFVQRGLKSLSRGKPSAGLTLANYQDARIRHYHQLLDRYLGS